MRERTPAPDHAEGDFFGCVVFSRCRTGGAGTGVAAAAGTAAAGPKAADAEMPTTFAARFALAKALHDDNVARQTSLEAASKAQRTLFVEGITKPGGIEFKVVEGMWFKRDDVPEYVPPTIIAIEDIFNDHVNYELGANPDDMLELNATMLPVMSKFKMFSHESPDCIAATAAFVANFRAINEKLAGLEALLCVKPGAMAAMQAECSELATRLATKAAELGVTVRAPATLGACTGRLAPLDGLGVTLDHLQFINDSLRTSGFAAPTFELLFQASLDGESTDDLIRKCQGKGPVLVVGRAAAGGWLFGGFMDCGIERGVAVGGECNREPAPQAFVFTLTNPLGSPPRAFRRTADGDWVGRCAEGKCHWIGGMMAGYHYVSAVHDAPSVLWWSAIADPAGGPYGLSFSDGTLFTGSRVWRASDVVVYRV